MVSSPKTPTPSKVREVGSGTADDKVVTIMLSAMKIVPKSPPVGGGES
jgi:hypothetical protein